MAAALAVAFAVAVGRYWVDDAMVLAAVEVLVVVEGIKRVSPTPAAEPPRGSAYPRSRIAHYVLLSRIKFDPVKAMRSPSPFERALLGEEGWQGLKADQLKTMATEAAHAARVEASRPPHGLSD